MDKKLTEEQLNEFFKSQGNKLGLLIAGSTLPEEIKSELVALASKMSLEQLERLLNIFEAKYADERTNGIDEKYIKKLEEAVAKYRDEQGKVDNDFLKQIKSLENYK